MKYIVDTEGLKEYQEPVDRELPKGRIIVNHNFYWYEVFAGDGKSYITFDLVWQYIQNIILLAIMLQEFRDWYGKSISIESWLREEYYNNVVLPSKGYASSTSSDHLEGRAADTNIPVSSNNITKWRSICRSHGVYASWGMYSWGMHLGFRYDKEHSWDYR